MKPMVKWHGVVAALLLLLASIPFSRSCPLDPAKVAGFTRRLLGLSAPVTASLDRNTLEASPAIHRRLQGLGAAPFNSTSEALGTCGGDAVPSSMPGMDCSADLLGGTFRLHWGNVSDTAFDVAAEAKGLGWVAVGFPSARAKMVGAEAVIGWTDRAGLRTQLDVYKLKEQFINKVVPSVVSFEIGNAQVRTCPLTLPLPLYKETQNTHVEESADGVTVMRFTATRTLPGQQGCNQPGGEACELLVAYHTSNDRLSMHSDRGSAVLDLETATLRRVSTTNVRMIWSVHGWLCVIGWGLLIPAATIVARTLKDIGPLWIQLHILLNLAGIVVALVGAAVALAHLRPPENAKHRQLGIVATALSLVQPINGFIRPKPQAGLVRVAWEWAHLIVGRSSIVFAIVATFLGIERYEFITGVERSHWSYVFGGYLIALFMVYLMLEQRRNRILEGKQLEKLQAAAGKAGTDGGKATAGEREEEEVKGEFRAGTSAAQTSGTWDVEELDSKSSGGSGRKAGAEAYAVEEELAKPSQLPFPPLDLSISGQRRDTANEAVPAGKLD